MSERNILVFGASGVGKSSLINLLTGSTLKAADTARGVTFDFATVSHTHNGVNYAFTDTCGLNEGESGTVDHKKAFRNLMKLLKSSNGWNLLVFVIRKPRVLNHDTKNFELFSKVIAEEKIPVLCVVLGCEDLNNMQEWWENNFDALIELKIAPQEFVGGTCASTDNRRLQSVYEELKEETKSAVWKAIETTCGERISIYTTPNKFWKIVRNCWNLLTIAWHIPGWRWVNQKVVDMLLHWLE